jgi:hypothetical protein
MANGLVSPLVTGDETLIAPNTSVGVNGGHGSVIQVKFFPFFNLGQSLPL